MQNQQQHTKGTESIWKELEERKENSNNHCSVAAATEAKHYVHNKRQDQGNDDLGAPKQCAFPENVIRKIKSVLKTAAPRRAESLDDVPAVATAGKSSKNCSQSNARSSSSPVPAKKGIFLSRTFERFSQDTVLRRDQRDQVLASDCSPGATEKEERSDNTLLLEDCESNRNPLLVDWGDKSTSSLEDWGQKSASTVDAADPRVSNFYNSWVS